MPSFLSHLFPAFYFNLVRLFARESTTEYVLVSFVTSVRQLQQKRQLTVTRRLERTTLGMPRQVQNHSIDGIGNGNTPTTEATVSITG